MRKDRLKIGRRTERQIANYFCKIGRWIDYYQPPRAKYSNADIFNCFDLLGLARTKDGCVITEYLQVKSHISDYYKAKRKIKDWYNKTFTDEPIDRFLLACNDKGKMRLYHFIADYEEKFKYNPLSVKKW